MHYRVALYIVVSLSHIFQRSSWNFVYALAGQVQDILSKFAKKSSHWHFAYSPLHSKMQGMITRKKGNIGLKHSMTTIWIPGRNKVAHKDNERLLWWFWLEYRHDVLMFIHKRRLHSLATPQATRWRWTFKGH